MATESKSKKKKNISSFYVPPPARKSENTPEPMSKERGIIKLSNEKMKVCDDSSLLFKSEGTNLCNVNHLTTSIMKKNNNKEFEILTTEKHFNNQEIIAPVTELVNCDTLKLSTTAKLNSDKELIEPHLTKKEITQSLLVSDEVNLSAKSLAFRLKNVSITSTLEDSSKYQLNIDETKLNKDKNSELSESKNISTETSHKNLVKTTSFHTESINLLSNKQLSVPDLLSTQTEVNEEVSDDWEKLLDEDDLNSLVVKSNTLRNDTLMKKSHNFNKVKEKCEENGENDSSIIEIYGFPEEFKTQDLYASFSLYVNRGLNLIWVDNAHVLGIFPSSVIADEVLNSCLPFVKTRSLNCATPLSKEKAKQLILPTTSRPKTCIASARRLVSGALGVRAVFTPEEIKAEKKMLKEAREQRKLAARQRDDAWEGKF